MKKSIQLEEKQPQKIEETPVLKQTPQDNKQTAADRAAFKELSKKKSLAAKLEKQIEQIEAEMNEIETKLSSVGQQDDIMDLTRDYLEKKRELDIKMDQWSQLEI